MTSDKTALAALEKFIKLHTAIDDRKSPNYIKRNISEEAFAAKDAFEQLRAIINTRPQPSGDAVKDAIDALDVIDSLIKNGEPTEYADTVYIRGLVQKCIPDDIRAALAPVDVDAGLRALDYQRDLALIFLVAKGSKDYDETIGDRIERVQELILQLKKQNDHLAARGCFVPEGYALVPIEPTREMILSGSNYYQKHGALSPCIPADIYKAMIKAAPKKEGG